MTAVRQLFKIRNPLVEQHIAQLPDSIQTDSGDYIFSPVESIKHLQEACNTIQNSRIMTYKIDIIAKDFIVYKMTKNDQIVALILIRVGEHELVIDMFNSKHGGIKKHEIQVIEQWASKHSIEFPTTQRLG